MKGSAKMAKIKWHKNYVGNDLEWIATTDKKNVRIGKTWENDILLEKYVKDIDIWIFDSMCSYDLVRDAKADATKWLLE